jgi:hypothetical protein
LTHRLFAHVIKGGPAGGGFSTVQDLLYFAKALLSYELLSPEYTEIVLTAKPEINSPEYGFGFHVSEGKAGRVVGHSGGFVGINARLDMYLDLGYTVAVLANCSPPAAGIVADAMGRMILS